MHDRGAPLTPIGPSGGPRRADREWPRLVIGAGAVVPALALWQGAAATGLVDPTLVASPTEVARALTRLLLSGELWPHARVSLAAFVAGFAPAVAVGVTLGALTARIRPARELLGPLIGALYTTPRVAFLPLLIVWLGVGVASKVAAVFLGAVFPVLVGTAAGVRQLDAIWERAVRALGARRRDVLTKVILPGSLPAIVASVRLGLGRALIGVIVAEMYAGVAGIGQLLVSYGNAGRAAELIALATVVGAWGLAIALLLGWAEARLRPWAPRIEA